MNRFDPTRIPVPPPEKTGWPWTLGTPGFPPCAIGTHQPRISIVTPSLNQGRFIEAAIRSILLQGYPNLEYVIMDGGSTDGTVEVLEKYQPWLAHWVSKPDGGQYEAISRGFEKTSGELMLWLNSDDMLMPGSLWVIASIFDTFPQVEWLTGIQVFWNEDGSFYRIFPQMRYHRVLMRLAGYEERAIHWVMQECTAWRRGLWERAGSRLSCAHPYAGDFELWLRFSSYAHLYTVAALLGGNRQHPAQKTAVQEDYCRDIDAVLKRHPVLRLSNSLLRLRFVKALVRAYLLSKRMPHHITFDANKNRWIMR